MVKLNDLPCCNNVGRIQIHNFLETYGKYIDRWIITVLRMSDIDQS